MKKYKCTCGVNFQNKTHAEDHQDLLQSQGFMSHAILERKLFGIIKDIFWYLPWEMIFRGIGFNIILFTFASHFNIHFGVLEGLLIGIAIGLIV